MDSHAVEIFHLDDQQQLDPSTSSSTYTTSCDGSSSARASARRRTESNPAKDPCSTNSPATPVGTDFNKDEYERNLETVKRIAVVRSVFYGLNWFLGVVALTWATTIILGGMINALRKRDYFSVAVLLMLEAVRMATARVFNFMSRRNLIKNSADPKLMDYTAWRDIAAGEVLRNFGEAAELAVLSVSIVLPARRLRDLSSGTSWYNSCDSGAGGDSSCDFNAFKISLQIFYIVVLVNAIIGSVGVIYSKTVLHAFFDARNSHDLWRYYDRIVWNGIDNGMLGCTDVDVFTFAFNLQARAYKARKRPPGVKENYKELIMYLYQERGFEATKIALDSEDSFVREAAANVVGFWLSLGKKKLLKNYEEYEDNVFVKKKVLKEDGETLMLQEALLSKLADVLEHDSVGRAATYSFEQLVHMFPEEALEVKNTQGENLVNILIKRIHQGVLFKKPDKAVIFVKVLVAFMDGLGEKIIHNLQPWIEQLREDLLQTLKQSKYKRTQILTTYALLTLHELVSGPHKDLKDLKQIKDVIVVIKSNKKPHAPKDKKDGKKSQWKLQCPKFPLECKGSWSLCANPVTTLWNFFVLKLVVIVCYFVFLKPGTIIYSNVLVWIWNKIILDFSVGRKPIPNEKEKKEERKKFEQHILTQEIKYLKPIVDILNDELKLQGDECLNINHEGLLASWEGKVELRDPSKRTNDGNLPDWLKDIKMTNYNLAIIMVIVMTSLCSFLIFYKRVDF